MNSLSRTWLFILLATAWTMGGAGQARAAAKPATVDFARDIKPILEARCVSCHGPRKKKGGLRLDSRAALLAEGDEGVRVKPGDAAGSQLVKLVESKDDDERMPPEKAGARLGADEVAKIRAWIDAGAVWPDNVHVQDAEGGKLHWSLVAPIRPPVPAVRTSGWARGAIDKFVLARLEKENLAPSEAADKTTWLRRVHFDLTGLPPGIEETDAFLRDRSPTAHDKVVQRLLASPHFGERWGRHWLDAARYADSNGYEKDAPRSIWFYRDWVIDALNRDLPYDQFIIEQVAGDQLPRATQSQRVATGFLRNSMRNEEGGVDPEQFRMEALVDRMDAIGKSVLGLTVQCAQCHSHKFDPITQEDYYRLFAFLNNDDEPTIAVFTPEEEKRRRTVLDRIARAEDNLRLGVPDLVQRLRRYEAELKKQQADQTAAGGWTVLQAPFIDDSTGGQKLIANADGSFVAQGYAPTKHSPKFVIKTAIKTLAAFRIELLTDPNLPFSGPGRAYNGTGALTEFEVEAAPADRPGEKLKLVFASATSDFEQPERPLEANFSDKTDVKRITGGAALAIDGKVETAWGIDAGPGRRNAARNAIFVVKDPPRSEAGFVLTVTLVQKHGGWNSDDNMNHNLGRFRVATTARTGARADLVPPPVRALLAKPENARSADDHRRLFSHYRTTVAEWRPRNQQIDALWAGYPEGTGTLALQPRDKSRPTHMLTRGEFGKLGREVQPGAPSALHPMPPGAGGSRLALARWLVDPRSPTTARVLVNRVWHHLFGTGFVTSAEDLGAQSEPPSHPELLDFLAVEFAQGGYRLKDLLRLIVKSATYRQSSRVTPALLEKDPYNRLLARGPRARVEAEIVRDMMLAGSGLLDPRMGGPPVMPPAPAFLFLPPVSYGPFPWIDAEGTERYRRSVYIFRRRTTAFPMLQTFDTPNGDTSCVRRVRSNTPLQALATLNEPLSMEASRALARLALAQPGADDGARLTFTFRRVLSRAPTNDERAELTGLLDRQRQRLRDGTSGVWAIAHRPDQAPRDLPPGVTPTELAAFTIVARTVLNLDEAITKE